MPGSIQFRIDGPVIHFRSSGTKYVSFSNVYYWDSSSWQICNVTVHPDDSITLNTNGWIPDVTLSPADAFAFLSTPNRYVCFGIALDAGSHYPVVGNMGGVIF